MELRFVGRQPLAQTAPNGAATGGGQWRWGVGTARAGGKWGLTGGPCRIVPFHIIQIFSKPIQFLTGHNRSSRAREFSNKIWVCMFGNKEQISLSKFFKIQNQI
jgi:hypothetical protein